MLNISTIITKLHNFNKGMIEWPTDSWAASSFFKSPEASTELQQNYKSNLSAFI